ncbi:MAG TPA: hypothetical protein VGQ93_13705 [Lysobacter sp.]|nr:hypothetical protein [Lysobacter sp.]
MTFAFNSERKSKRKSKMDPSVRWDDEQKQASQNKRAKANEPKQTSQSKRAKANEAKKKAFNDLPFLSERCCSKALAEASAVEGLVQSFSSVVQMVSHPDAAETASKGQREARQPQLGDDHDSACPRYGPSAS